MRYLSTRSAAHSATLPEAIERGLAPDGGLYVPERLPRADLVALRRTLDSPKALPELAARLLEPFFAGDPLAQKLPAIARQALDFPIPLRRMSDETALLELFHGPTAAFKDVGARFLAGCFGEMPSPSQRTILVATSGDTGGAVASAFDGKPDVQVVILFPKNGVSPFQEKQLTCWSNNIHSIKVRGTFDDCQRLVKEAFAAQPKLTSANSISIGRLLPQMVYYAWASLEHERETEQAPGFVIPSGNVGNALAAAWAMLMGLPIREIMLATNANHVVPDYFATGKFTPAPSVRTLANAMDVGNPSNLERLIRLLDADPSLKSRISAISVDDGRISQTIRQGASRYGTIFCPHTAAAVYAREQLGTSASSPWIVVATAHPAKFNDVVEPLLGKPAPIPPQLRALLSQSSRFVEIEPKLDALQAELSFN